MRYCHCVFQTYTHYGIRLRCICATSDNSIHVSIYWCIPSIHTRAIMLARLSGQPVGCVLIQKKTKQKIERIIHSVQSSSRRLITIARGRLFIYLLLRVRNSLGCEIATNLRRSLGDSILNVSNFELIFIWNAITIICVYRVY